MQEVSLLRPIIISSVPDVSDEGLLLRMIKGIATRSYQECAARRYRMRLWAIFIHRVETLYQGVGTKVEAVSGNAL